MVTRQAHLLYPKNESNTFKLTSKIAAQLSWSTEPSFITLTSAADTSTSDPELQSTESNHNAGHAETAQASEKGQNEEKPERRVNEVFGPKPTGLLDSTAIAIDEFVVELLDAKDPRVREKDFEKSKLKKVAELNRQKLWSKVKRKDFYPDTNILSGQFVLTLKNNGSAFEMAKVR